MKPSKTAHAFLIDGVRSRCCAKDADGKRVVLRADTDTFDVRIDQDAVFLIWKNGISGKPIIATFKRPAFGATKRDGVIEVFLESGVPAGRNSIENFHGGANSQGSDISIFRGGQTTEAVEVQHVGDGARGITVAKVAAMVQASPLRRTK